MGRINAVKYDITKQWQEEAHEYGMSFMRGERINDGTERRGFKMAVKSKSAGKVGEFAVCQFCEDHNIPYMMELDRIDKYGYDKCGYDIIIGGRRYEIKTKNCGGRYTSDWTFMIVKDQYERYARRTSPYGYIFCIVLPEEVHIVGYILHLRFDRIKRFASYGDILRDGFEINCPANYYVYIDDLKPIGELIGDDGWGGFMTKKTREKLKLGDFM